MYEGTKCTRYAFNGYASVGIGEVWSPALKVSPSTRTLNTNHREIGYLCMHAVADAA